MKIQYLILSFLFIASLHAEKEVYFNSKVSDSISVKSIKGVQFEDRFGFQVLQPSIGYFDERKIGSTATVVLGGKVTRVSDYKLGSNYIKYITRPALSFYCEPRWNIGFKQRYMRGARTWLNSGWTIGLPIEVGTSLLDVNLPVSIYATISPTLHYRYAFFKHLFFEASLGRPFHIEKTSQKQTLQPGVKLAYVL